MRDGILLVDKPAGLSSAAVVARVKRGLRAERVGHAGTLDPEATGLLIILINGATRVASYAADGYKVYTGAIRLGVTTSTDDLAGEILTESKVTSSPEEVVLAAKGLTGQIQQVPPKVSAKKLDGKRAYKLHLQGHEFELAPRAVDVKRFELSKGDGQGEHEYRYEVEVSPGTYVRALARDLGKALGCGAAVASIRRERSGKFSVSEAYSLEQVSWESVRDWGDLVPELPRISVTSEVANGLLQGQQWALGAAWRACNVSTVEGAAHHVVYHREGSEESLGILNVVPEGRFGFGLNIVRRLTGVEGSQEEKHF